jgi:hypothetical protein
VTSIHTICSDGYETSLRSDLTVSVRALASPHLEPSNGQGKKIHDRAKA